MARKIVSVNGNEPTGITPTIPNYASALSRAFNWYNQEKEKKDARAYLRFYITHTIGKTETKTFDRVPDSKISTTWGWVSRMIMNGCVMSDKHKTELDLYIKGILQSKELEPEVEEVKEDKPARPSVRDYMQEKVSEYLGELEGVIDDMIYGDREFSLYNDLKTRAIPNNYCQYIDLWLKEKAQEFIFVYETTDKEIKEAYAHIGKRKLTQLIKAISTWVDDLERYGQFKKANRKPRVKKVKPAGVQVAKLKYKREDTEIGIKSVSVTDIVGASQVWVYNTKYKKLAAYRTEDSTGIQVKGTTLQNYDPDLCEQKTLRNPAETLKAVINAGKVQLRRIIPELTTKASEVNGRVNEDCIIVRVIK